MASLTQHSGVVYLLTAPTRERYVGRTVDYERRMGEYRRGEGHGMVAAAIELHGWENFTKRPIAVGVADSALVATETAFITLLRPELNLMTTGISGRLRHAESTKRQMRAAHRGKKYGPQSPEHRAAIAAGKRDKPASPEARANMRAAAIIAQNRPEVKAHMIAMQAIGNARPGVSERRSASAKVALSRPETQARLRDGQVRRWARMSPAEKAEYSAACKAAAARPEVRANQRDHTRTMRIRRRIRELRELGWPRARE